MAAVEFERLLRADEHLNVDQRGSGGRTRERRRPQARALATCRTPSSSSPQAAIWTTPASG